MPILKSRYKLYGFCTGIFIIAITTIIGILIEKFSDKDMVHLNVQMYISLISCIFIGISTLHLTWNIFVAIYFQSLIFPSSHAFILNDYGSDNYDWEWDFTYFTENEEFAWTVYSQSLTGSIDTLYSKVLEEYYGKLNKKEGNSLTYTCMNETNMDEECISHESVENVVSPTNSDDGNSESK
ncbi:uncharacterized protein LOC130898584 isoform X2 [Diorhabda carinulata]|uniref:uncharacterized protein LOC130898584 isoform X2 n=1 Tax=Diorhabda carinulata TaxID=1163345 RepID=UPI0025A0E8AE|nr:uncharacterized protein LOC130898584 isoform X2 [Diorhabda carinulata]